MHPREIDILRVLLLRDRRHQILSKGGAAFVNRNCVTYVCDLRIVRSVRKGSEIIDVADGAYVLKA